MAVRHDEQLKEIWSFLKNHGGNHISHLSFLNDKQIYWAENKRVLIIYQKIGNKLTVLGDPIGEEKLISKGIEEFRSYCLRTGFKPVFYQVSPRYLPEYEKQGLRFVKLGEEARLYLPNFTLAGKKGAKLRTRKNKFEKQGYTFQVLIPPHSEEFLRELKEISDSWLGKRNEKGFSVSFFCENYLNHFPVAIIKNPEGKTIAFASLACNQNQKERTLTIDLMRYLQESPHGTMDFLFLSIFNWCKEQNYEWCSMGMSPLAYIKESNEAKWFELIGHFIFHNGNYFYNFKGLHEYKNKFKPEWESRYLVYQSRSLPLLILHIIRLIHKRNKASY